MNHTLTFVVFLSFLLSSWTVTATESSANLMEIYKIALSHDAELAKNQANSAAQQQAVPKSRAGLLPTIFLQGIANRERLEIEDNDTSDTFNAYGYGLKLTQPIFRLDRWFNLEAANAISEQAKLELSLSNQNLILRVALAYFNVLRAQENLATANAEEEAFASSLEQIEQQFEVGLTTITDVYDARARFDSAKVARISGESDLNTSFTELELLTGQSFETQGIFSLKDDFEISPPNPQTMSAWVDTALQKNLSIQITNFSKQTFEANLKSAKAQHLPTLDATASYDKQHDGSANFLGEDTNRTVIGLELTVPIFQGGATLASQREAAFRLEEARQQLLQTQREVMRDTKQLYQVVETDVYRIDAAKQALKSRESALEATEIGFQVGSRNIVDVLQSKSDFFIAKRDYLNAKFDYIINSLKLKQVVGTLSPEDLIALNQSLTNQPIQIESKEALQQNNKKMP